MAEFVQTMNDWRRMCMEMKKLHPHNPCGRCRLEEYGCPVIRVDNNAVDFCEVEKLVSAWAAEHPESVYPTWIEWLKSMGVVSYMTGLVVTRNADDGHFHDGHVNITEKALEAIPADIAQKLGIEPKEG